MICRCVILLRIGLCDRGTVRRFVGGPVDGGDREYASHIGCEKTLPGLRIVEPRSAFREILDSKVRRCGTRRPGSSLSEFGIRQREIRGWVIRNLPVRQRPTLLYLQYIPDLAYSPG